MVMNTTAPLHQFRQFVTYQLQKLHGWVGQSAYELERKYAAQVEQCWIEGETVDATAAYINSLQRIDSTPTAPRLPTRKEVAAAAASRGITMVHACDGQGCVVCAAYSKYAH